MDRHDFTNCDLLSCQCVGHPVGNESAKAFLIEMLKLTAATQRKMLAGRCRMMRTVHQSARWIDDIARRCMRNVTAFGGYAISARGDPDYLL